METSYTHQSIDNKLTNERQKRPLNRRAVMLIGGLSVAAAGLVGHEVHHLSQYEEVGTADAAVTENAIQAVDDGVNEIAHQKNIDPADIPNEYKVWAAQELASELPVNNAGAEVTVTVKKNGFGSYEVSADPAQPDQDEARADDELPAPVLRTPKD